MEETDPKLILVVFERFSGGLADWKWFHVWMSWVIRRQILRKVRGTSKRRTAFLFLVPDFFDRKLTPEATLIRWDEIPLLARCHAESLQDFLDYHHEVLLVLNANEPCKRRPIPLARVMAYGLMASHSEELPFWISGLRELFREKRISKLVLPACRSYFGELAEAVGRAGNMNSGRYFSFSLLLGGLAERTYRYLRNLAHIFSTFCFCYSVNSELAHADVLAPLGKGKRSLRFVQTMGEALREHFSRAVVYWWPEEVQRKFFVLGILQFGWQSWKWPCLWFQWRRSKTRLQKMPHSYKGVSIARFHFTQLQEVWFRRGQSGVGAA